MLPGVGGGELIVIAIVALIVVGPKDLPKLLRQLGKFVGRMRSMADDFRASFDDMARQSELDDLRKEVEALRTGKSVSPVIDDLTSDMHAISNEVSNSLNPMYSEYTTPPELMLPENFGGHTPDYVPTPEIAPPAKPKRRASRASKAEIPVETSPEALKPKRTRAKATAKANAGDI